MDGSGTGGSTKSIGPNSTPPLTKMNASGAAKPFACEKPALVLVMRR